MNDASFASELSIRMWIYSNCGLFESRSILDVRYRYEILRIF